MKAFLSMIVLLLLVGCSSQPASDRLSELERKVDQVIAKLDAAPPGQPPQEHAAIDPSKLKRESTTDLAWLLITNDPKEKAALISRRIQQSSVHKQLRLDNIQAVVADLEGLNVVLNAPEGIDLTLLQQVEESRNRMVALLQKEVPRIVEELDAKAVKIEDYAEAKQLWSQSSAVLGFYPASNDPVEAGRIQAMISSHDLVRTRTELAQQQRYNLWACQQIRKAWQDFQEQSDPGPRIATCLHFLGPIHPGLLDPVSLELYRDFLQTLHGKLGKELYQELSEKLATEKRQMPADLKETK
jgi:hypothetical protein